MIFLVLLRRPVRQRRRHLEIGHLALDVALARQVSGVHRLDHADHTLHVGHGTLVVVAAALRCEEVEEAKSLTLLGREDVEY